jgi:YesN/AraC family two-component response regulator
LIPGDVFLIQPHELHSYEIKSSAMITNCHFFPEELDAQCGQSLRDASSDFPQGLADVKKQWDELLRYVTMKDDVPESKGRHAKQKAQGVIHLTTAEMQRVEGWLEDMIQEQEMPEEGIAYMKSAYLQLILTFFKRVKTREYQRVKNYTSQKKAMIYDAISYIEEHLDEKINFSAIAENVYLNPNYFRGLFKDVTGLTPMEYLNRMRIVKSLEYLNMEEVSIADAAARVGIYDANYFSRMFKKVMGYSPRYFKKLP